MVTSQISPEDTQWVSRHCVPLSEAHLESPKGEAEGRIYLLGQGSLWEVRVLFCCVTYFSLVTAQNASTHAMLHSLSPKSRKGKNSWMCRRLAQLTVVDG